MFWFSSYFARPLCKSQEDFSSWFTKRKSKINCCKHINQLNRRHKAAYNIRDKLHKFKLNKLSCNVKQSKLSYTNYQPSCQRSYQPSCQEAIKTEKLHTSYQKGQCRKSGRKDRMQSKTKLQASNFSSFSRPTTFSDLKRY